jgi:hypothetical protein
MSKECKYIVEQDLHKSGDWFNPIEFDNEREAKEYLHKVANNLHNDPVCQSMSARIRLRKVEEEVLEVVS